VLTEVLWKLRHDPGASGRLEESWRQGLFVILPLRSEEFGKLTRLLDKYRTLPADLADVSLVYLAEREKIETVFTLDRKDFSVYRLPGKRPFHVIPE
jgi:predicted nucleic acid-binding protein